MPDLSRAESAHNVEKFIAFIHERECVRLRKQANQPRPWTTDPILHKYRFCNVDRNDDTVTKWIHDVLVGYNPASPSLWIMLVVGRLFNNPDSLKNMSFPLSGDQGRWINTTRAMLHRRKKAGQGNFNSAYIVSTNGRRMDKVDYLLDIVLAPMLASLPGKHTRCRDWGSFLLQFQGMGDFMVNQIVTDMRYTRYLPKESTPDWTTWVLPGPGTKRGLNRIFNGSVNDAMDAGRYQSRLAYLQDVVMDSSVWATKIQHLSSTFQDPNNVANCLCEFDKYERCRLGEGTPKQLYTPAED